MKKQYIILMLLLLCSSLLFSQVEKGKWYIAGNSNLGLDIGKTKYESSNGITDEYKYTEFNFSPSAGYFVIDKLAAGLFIDYNYYKDINQADDDTWKSNSFIIGPFAKYYILEYKKLWPYVGVGVGFGSGKSELNGEEYEKYKMSTFRIGGGATYFLSENVGFDLFLGYNKDVDKSEIDEAGYKSSNSSDTSDDIYSAFKMSIGVVVTFGK
jgi:outer membrane protein